MLEWDILNYLKKWRTNLRATFYILNNLLNRFLEVNWFMPRHLNHFTVGLKQRISRFITINRFKI